MKTVQEWLHEVDEKELTDTYLAEFPIDYKMIADRSLTLGVIRNRCKERFLAYLHELKPWSQPNQKRRKSFLPISSGRLGTVG